MIYVVGSTQLGWHSACPQTHVSESHFVRETSFLMQSVSESSDGLCVQGTRAECLCWKKIWPEGNGLTLKVRAVGSQIQRALTRKVTEVKKDRPITHSF